MSNTMIVSLTVSQLEDLIQKAVKDALSGSPVSLSAPSGGGKGGKKAKKEKDPSAPKKDPSAWALLCKALNPRVSALYKSTMAVEKVPQGFPMKACGLLKERGQTEDVSDEQIVDAIRYLAENPEHKSKTQTVRKASDASESGAAAEAAAAAAPAAEAKPKKRAAKKAEAAAATAPAAEPKAKKAKAAPVPAPEPEEDEAEEEVVFVKKAIGGKKYLWSPQNNHCYTLEADGSQGDWAGILNAATGKIDAVPEPADAESDSEDEE